MHTDNAQQSSPGDRIDYFRLEKLFGIDLLKLGKTQQVFQANML